MVSSLSYSASSVKAPAGLTNAISLTVLPPQQQHSKKCLSLTRRNLPSKLTYSLFNFGYNLGIVPYRFELQGNECCGELRVSLKTSPIHKVSAILCWFAASLFHFLNQRRRITFQIQHSNVLVYFNVVHAAAHSLAFTIFYAELFRKKAAFQMLMARMSNSELLTHYTRQRNDKILTLLIYTVLVLFLIGIPSGITLDPLEQNGWDVVQTVKWHIVHGSTYFWERKLSEAVPNPSMTKDLSNFSTTEILFGIVPVLTGLSYFTMSAFRSLSFIFPGMNLYIAVKSFMTFIRESKLTSASATITRDQLLEKYGQLKSLANAINEAYAVSLFYVLMDHILWLATDLNLGIQERSLALRVANMWWSMDVLILSSFSAEACRRMREFKGWLVEAGPDIFQNQEEYSNFLASVEVNGISIGIAGLYTLDYSFIAQVVVLVITLFIITLQSERPST